MIIKLKISKKTIFSLYLIKATKLWKLGIFKLIFNEFFVKIGNYALAALKINKKLN